MKVLLYGINFAPEPIGVGRYTGEMAQKLSAAGHEVRVITALPYYPEWKVSSDYSKWQYATETMGDIKVYRAPLWVPKNPRGRQRVLHLLSFAVTTLPLLVRQWLWRPHVVWMAAPSLVCAPAALVTAKVCGAKSWIHVQDFEIDIAFGMGIISGNFSHRLITRIEQFLLTRFDRLSTISKAMLGRAKAKGMPETKTVHVPNWVDLRAIVPLRGPSPYRQELGIAEDAAVALYSGSMGVKQGVDWLAEVALQLADTPGLVFVFSGDGPLKDAAQAACGHLPNVRFIPLQPVQRLGDLLGLADIHLLPQRPDASAMVMPSKLTGMLASGRPVVAMAEPGTELAEVVQTCGVVTAPGDLKAFAESVRFLSTLPTLRTELGHAGRAYADSHLSASNVLSKFESELQGLLAPVRPVSETP